MKQFRILFISIFFFSCEPKAQNSSVQNLDIKNSDSIYGRKLIKNDFLKYTDNFITDSLKTEVINNFNIYDENNLRIAHIDAEELAKFNFDFFLPQLNKILAKRNVSLIVTTSIDYEKTNDIIINNETIKLYTKKELENQSFWDTAPRIFFRKLNQILKSKNINEQFYLLYDGNDLQTILLTNEQFLIITEYYNNKEKEKPYLP